MHILEKHYLGLELRSPSSAQVLNDTALFAANTLSYLLNDKASKNYSAVEKEAFVSSMRLFILNRYVKGYLFTEAAQKVIDKIKVADSFDLQILKVLPEGEAHYFTLLYGKDRVIYCMWSNHVLYIVDLSREGGRDKIKTNICVASLNSSPKMLNCILIDTIKCLIFLKLTEPEIIHLAAGKKVGTRKQGHYNATPLPVIIVDSTWNKYIVRTEGFGVSGHFRMQPHGKGNADLKLIWIPPFEKRGYVRLPKTEPILEETK
jgi:hypothetical protein